MNTGLTDLNVNAVTVVGTTVLAATYTAVFKSTNNGSTWTLAKSMNIAGNFITSGTKAYISSGLDIVASSDNGSTWTALASRASTGSTLLYVSGSNLFTIQGTDLYVSTNDGSSWTKIYTGTSHGTVRGVTVAGLATVIATDNGVFQSLNNGATWTDIGTGIPALYGTDAVFNNGTRMLASVNLSSGTYYRNVSEITSVEELFNDEKISIYPNPNNGVFTINTAEGTDISITNTLGEVVFTTKVNDYEKQIEVNGLKPGFYVVNLKSADKSVVKKISVK